MQKYDEECPNKKNKTCIGLHLHFAKDFIFCIVILQKYNWKPLILIKVLSLHPPLPNADGPGHDCM